MWVDVDQFYGIEFEEFPARIAEVAMWLMDHQMNMAVSEAFGQYVARLPLKKAANIVHGNALQIEWESVVPKERLSFILGNPPFVGKKEQKAEQKIDMKIVFAGVDGAGVLDYVTAWYLKAAKYIKGTQIIVGFVSTNSIVQGEQTGILWGLLFQYHKVKIHFAHRTFTWKNEAKNNASVHVAIIGFGGFDIPTKRVFEYGELNQEPHELTVKNINPYLVEGKDIFLKGRTMPLCNAPEMIKGSESTDDGHFLLTDEDINEIREQYPEGVKFIRPLLSGGDFLNNRKRYCLWLKHAKPEELKQSSIIQDRIERVREFRLKSPKDRTRLWAEMPTLFTEDRQPSEPYLVIPKVSSLRRKYIPFAYGNPESIINNTASYIQNASAYHFGILESRMHMAWMETVCGRTKSDYQYSNKIVYNNFPWPESPTEKQIAAIEAAVKDVFEARALFPDSSLSDLYDPLTIPPSLSKAHQTLDKVVDLAYRSQAFITEAKRMEFLFELYEKYSAGIFSKQKRKLQLRSKA